MMQFAMTWPLVMAASAPTIWVLTCLAFASIGLMVLVMNNPALLGRGQDPAGKAMAQGCAMFLLVSGAMVFGISAAVLAWRNESATLTTRIVATLPAAIVLLALATAFVMAQVASARGTDASYAAKLKIPIFLLVDDADENLSAMYDALRSRYPVTEMQLRRPAALHWQLGDYVPRARIICLNADVPPKPDEIGLTNDSRMIVDDLTRCQPSGPILLFSRDPAQVQPFAQKLMAAGWSVRVIARTGNNWFPSAFLAHVTELLKDFVEAARH